ncbi:hypothetical protein JK358_32920 [Nocardia sp. 2]|uniref:HTH HARE-type domain-containing protein n=1 Tax=Nocardia acididurans TaxID=2802282 RepID=A0ABS1MG35_9NOCA|nr:hypothetical protein [Nocardia acididurans]MBL1079219.1 hypothetical protein [Nocardia acididurans]
MTRKGTFSVGVEPSNTGRTSEAIVAEAGKQVVDLLTHIGRYYQTMYNLGDIRTPDPELYDACAKFTTVADWLSTARYEQLQEDSLPTPAASPAATPPRRGTSIPQAVAEIMAENPGQTWTPTSVATALQQRGMPVGASDRHHVKVALGRMALREDSNIQKLDRGKYQYSPADPKARR